MTPCVSVIIINWNGLQYLPRCLSSVVAQTYPNLEVILMDNGSSDGSANYTRAAYPKVQVIASDRNLGTSVGNNIAAQQARGEYLFLMNSDAWFTRPNTISTLIQCAEQNPSAAIIGCQVLNVNGTIQDIGEKIDALGFPGGLSPDKHPLPTIIDDVFFATSCAVLIRAAVFKEVGGYDPRFFWSHEEVDLAWQARLRGYKVLIATDAVVTHVGGGSMVGGAPGKEPRYRTTTARIYHRERSTLATLLKNYSTASLLKVLPVYICINVMETLYFLVRLQPNVSQQYVRAYWWNLQQLPSTLRARRRIQRRRSVSDREIVRYFWPGIRKLQAVKMFGLPRIDTSSTGARSRSR